MNKLEFLLDEIDAKILLFKNDSDKHKCMHRRFRYVAFTVTAILSILAGLALYLPDYHSPLNVCILLLSAVAGALTSLEGIRKPEELWIHERTTYYTLSDLKREIEFESKGDIDDALLGRFFSRFQQLLSNSGEKWSSGIVQGKQVDEEDS